MLFELSEKDKYRSPVRESRTKSFSQIYERFFSFSRIHERKKADSRLNEHPWGASFKKQNIRTFPPN